MDDPSPGTPIEAAEISNHASSVVVAKLGTATLTPDEFLKSFRLNNISDMNLLLDVWSKLRAARPGEDGGLFLIGSADDTQISKHAVRAGRCFRYMFRPGK